MYKIFFTVLFLFAQSSHSQTEGQFIARGAGTMSCGEYISAVELRNPNTLAQINQWVWGYLASYMMRGTFNPVYKEPTRGDIRIPDGKTIELFLKNYCNRNPLSSLLPAANQLIKESGGVISY